MSSLRENDSTRANINAQFIFGTGQFKLVYKGVYTQGSRTGQECVAKVFKTGSVYEDSFFAHELAVVQKALQIIQRFNDANLINRKIILNQPAIWEYEHDNSKVLIEPMIVNFQKFNSNSGWTDDDGTAWSDVMQALSHFSYHSTGGAFVLCDIQGGVYSDGVVLTDPVVLSRDLVYGPTDLGPAGISTFFSRHVCNQFCRAGWTRPRSTVAHFPAVQGTSMVAVPTRNSRTPMSNHYGDRR